MRKRIFVMFLIAMMIFSMADVGVLAADFTNEISTDYLPGSVSITVDKDDYVGGDATITSTGVKIDSEKSATFGFYARYATRSVTLTFENASGNTTINIGENVYAINESELSDNGEYTLVFGENLGKTAQPYFYNNQSTSGYYREFAEQRGDKEVTVSTTGEILLKKMVFERDKSPKIRDFGIVESKITDEETVFLTTVALKENASAILVNGGRRYINNNNTAQVPYNYKGSLYIPIETLAKALGYYHEDQPEKGYALMRSDTHEVVMLDGVCSVRHGLSETKISVDKAFIYHNGKTLAGVRYFAELTGKAVEYDNGLVVIDNKYAVRDILGTPALHAYANDKLAPFVQTGTVGKTYYVAQNDKNASDTAEDAGSEAKPFKTLTKAAKVAKAGDTVIVREGVYRESLTPENDGEANAPITFRAEGDGVIISANDTLGEWAQYKDSIYTTPMTWDMGKTRNQIFIDNIMQTEARYPNGPGVINGSSPVLSNAWPVRGDLHRVAGNKDIIHSDTLIQEDTTDYWKGGTFVGLFGSAWNMCSANIIGSSKGELQLGSEKTKYWFPIEEDREYPDSYGFIVGHMNALDEPGEWHLENGKLYMIFPDSITPNTTPVEAKARERVIDLNNKKFINIEGFDTIGGSVRMNGSEMCMLNGVDMKYISHFYHTADQHAGYIDFDYDAGPQVSGLNSGDYGPNRNDTDGAPEQGLVGNYITGTDNIFVNGSVDHSAGSAFYLSGRYTYLDNNMISNTGYMPTFLGAVNIINRGYEDIGVPTGGHAIYNNTICNVGRSNLNIGSIRNGDMSVPFLPIDFGYNDLHDGTLASNDAGLTYGYEVSLGYDGVMSKEHHNYVYRTIDEIDKGSAISALYHDNGNFGFDSFKNKIFYTKDNATFTHAVFEQTMPNAVANFFEWDNTYIGYLSGGKDEIVAEFFAEDKPFFAGCKQCVDYSVNYLRFKNKTNDMDATVSDNGTEFSSSEITIDESGYAKFTSSGQWIKFTNVDFGTNNNQIALAVKGNAYHTYDEIDVIIGETMDTGKHYPIKISNNSPDSDIPLLVSIGIEPFSGQQNVFIKVNDFKSLEVGGISTYLIEENIPDSEYVMYTQAGAFDEYEKWSSSSSVFSLFPTAEHKEMIVPSIHFVTQTRPGYYIKYNQMEFTDVSDTFVFVGGSEGVWANQPIEVYVGGITWMHKVASFNVANTTWSDKTPQYVSLSREIQKGTYDVYLKFTEESGYDKASSIYSIGFTKKASNTQ